MERITQAIVLAAGEGQRLKPFTSVMPKVMIPVAGKPMLQYVIEALAANGVRRIVLVVGYRKEQVQDYFGSGQDFGVEIEYAIQRQQLGVAHALKQAGDLADESFLLIMGDNMIRAETIAPLVNASSSTMLTKTVEDTSRYGKVTIRDGIVKMITRENRATDKCVDVGAYALTRDIFENIGDEVSLVQVFQNVIAAGYQIAALQTEEFWHDAVFPWDILKLNSMCLAGVSPATGGTIEEGATIKGAVSTGDNTIIRSGSYIVGPAIIGEDCEIGPNACVFPSTSIGNNVILSPFSMVRNCVIEKSVSIGPGSHLNDSIVASGTTIGSHFAARSDDALVTIEQEHYRVEMGAIIGNYSTLGDFVVVEPGSIIGNNCRVSPMNVISENIPDDSRVI
ncbi:MAG: sugar phosphate nucleotidyltransferase [Dehalococcoidia bacterium]